MFNAYYDARRNKRNTANQLRFEIDLEENLVGLYHEIAERRYEVGRSVCFMINRPVSREVFAADFRDRVVHHLLFNYINPVFDKTFIDDSYSCRKGRGTLYGVRRLESHIRSCSLNYTRNCYVLKLDLRGYFMNIDRKILYDEIMRTMLGATLHPQKVSLVRCDQGLSFLGSYVKPFRRYLTPRFYANFNSMLYGGRFQHWDTATKERLRCLRSSVNSYLGQARHSKSRRRVERALRFHPYLFKLGYLEGPDLCFCFLKSPAGELYS